MSDTSWMLRGACRDEDPELFFPEGESAKYQAQIEAAKRVCADCPVRAECLAYVTEQRTTRNRLTGIWGGTTDEDRERAARRRRYLREKAVA